MKSLILLTFIFLSISSSFALYGAKSFVKKLTKENMTSEVLDSKGVWMVEFFAPWCGHCKSLAPEFEKAARALYGIANLGAVDMTTDQEAGAGYDISGYPTLKIFGKDKKNPIAFEGDRKAQAIIDAVLEEVRKIVQERLTGKRPTDSKAGGGKKEEAAGSDDDSDVIVLTDENFDSLVLESDEPWFIEFYAPWCGHCKKLAPEWNAMATELKGELKVAKVDATVATRIGQKYDIKGYPGIKFFPGKNKSKPIDYDGGRTKNPMVEWAREQVAGTKPLVAQLISQQQYTEQCINYKGLCVIVFLPHILDSSAVARNNYIQDIEDIAKKRKGDPFTFLWAQGGDQLKMEEHFACGGAGYPAVLAVSSKKNVYSVLRGSFSRKSLRDFVSNLSLGKEAFVPFNSQPKIRETKEWDGKDAPKNEDL